MKIEVTKHVSLPDELILTVQCRLGWASVPFKCHEMLHGFLTVKTPDPVIQVFLVKIDSNDCLYIHALYLLACYLRLN